MRWFPYDDGHFSHGAVENQWAVENLIKFKENYDKEFQNFFPGFSIKNYDYFVFEGIVLEKSLTNFFLGIYNDSITKKRRNQLQSEEIQDFSIYQQYSISNTLSFNLNKPEYVINIV